MNRNLTVGLVIAAIAGLLFSFPSSGSAGDVLIISNKSVSADSLTNDDVKKIFIGKKTRWDDNKKISFVLMDSNGVHKDFLREYVKRTPAQYRRFWKKQVFTGKGRRPISFKVEKDMIEYVANTSGAIGYISASAATDGVKVLSINF
ncbi:MAG: substrate-binding domain-containing protein [Deltaproteobacteria bacterium]|nr:substrate-binding domain-containing protein [Deltaproteobacteria bacterium]